MGNLLEYVGSVHIYLGPYRGNPIALYLKRSETGCQIGPKVYPWNDVVGTGETPNKAAADFESKWKTKGLSEESNLKSPLPRNLPLLPSPQLLRPHRQDNQVRSRAQLLRRPNRLLLPNLQLARHPANLSRLFLFQLNA